MPNLTGPTAIVIVLIVLLLFGAPKLPALARSLGQSMKILKKEITTPEDDKTNATASDAAASEGSTSEPAVRPAAADEESQESEIAKARAEAAAAKAEADALRAAAEKRGEGGGAS